jgi:hypothetical protein
MPDEAPEPAIPTAPPPGPVPPQPAQGPNSGAPLLAPQPLADDKQRTIDLIGQIERNRRSRVLVYWTSPLARMSEAAVPTFYDQLCAIGDVGISTSSSRPMAAMSRSPGG